ncbi:ketoacyl-synthetase C-terminal extension domain-containing protein, partial [Lysobacter sp. 2RAB21]
MNLRHENALFDFAASPFYVSRTRHDWRSAAGRKRRAAVSAFGFSGTNAHVVIEEYQPLIHAQPAQPQPCIVPLSARTGEQLAAMAQDLLAFLDRNTLDSDAFERGGADIALRDLAYTLQT